jgi:hypothetical protein
VAETEGGGGTGEPSVEELIEQIRGIDVGQFLLSTVSTLASLTYGKLDNGDLTGARVGIDALTALIPVLEGQVEAETIRDLQSAVANLQVAYAGASGSPDAST